MFLHNFEDVIAAELERLKNKGNATSLVANGLGGWQKLVEHLVDPSEERIIYLKSQPTLDAGSEAEFKGWFFSECLAIYLGKPDGIHVLRMPTAFDDVRISGFPGVTTLRFTASGIGTVDIISEVFEHQATLRLTKWLLGAA